MKQQLFTLLLVLISTFTFSQSNKKEATVNGMKEGTLSVYEAKSIGGIHVDSTTTILSYTLTAKSHGLYTQIKGYGGMINSQMQTVLHNLKKGDIIYFEYIKARNKNGVIYKLDPIKLTIK